MKFELGKTYILDNIIPFSYQKYLFNLYSNSPFWNPGGFLKNTGYATDKVEEFYLNNICSDPKTLDQIEDFSQFGIHVQSGEGEIISIEHYVDLIPILHYIQQYFNYKFFFKTKRIKLNLQTAKSLKKPNTFSYPHADLGPTKDNIYTMIYYFNDSDGDTILFKENIKPSPVPTLNIEQKIQPKQGRCILFPANKIHAGCFPITSEYRMVINFNFSLIDNLN